MALIYRSIVEVEDPAAAFAARIATHVESWLRWKCRDTELEIPEAGDILLDEHGLEIQVRHGLSSVCQVRRISVFENQRDDGLRVKTTSTAILGEDTSWCWIDLERWTHEAHADMWIPSPPGLVGAVLRQESCHRGGLAFAQHPTSAEAEGGVRVAEHVLNPRRDAQLVVVSYNERVPDDGVVAIGRGRALAKRLAGVAPVFVLGKGAVEAFSREITGAVGEGFDVHSGAVRVYQPGVGSPNDYAGRHRYVPFHKLSERPVELAAAILTPQVLRRAVEIPPPRIWRAAARELVQTGVGADTSVFDELFDEMTKTIEDLGRAESDIRVERDEERLENAKLARENDHFKRLVGYLRDRLRKLEPEAVRQEPGPDPFDPVLSIEVLTEGRARLSRVVLPDHLDTSVQALDAQGDESWAGRAWRALRALDNYAALKGDGTFDGSFATYCGQAAGDHLIPEGWVALTETKQTMANAEFRRQRTLPVETEVSASGEIVMESHIKIVKGSPQAPRIHFHDDTRGSTGKIHIGWFGAHLDSWAKS